MIILIRVVECLDGLQPDACVSTWKEISKDNDIGQLLITCNNDDLGGHCCYSLTGECGTKNGTRETYMTVDDCWMIADSRG